MDRESNFADPRIVNLIIQQTVPVAIDQWNHRRQQDTEGEFWRKIAGQGPRASLNFEQTTQGLYVVAPDGRLLGYTNNRSPDVVLASLKTFIKKYRPAKTKAIGVKSTDNRFALSCPANGLTVRVRAKVMGGYPETADRWRKIFQAAVSRDNLWISEQEHKQLAKGVFPEILGRRIARYHCLDNTRGESPAWKKHELRSCEFQMNDGVIVGRAFLSTDDKKRTYEVRFRGMVEAENNRITKLTLAGLGLFSGRGPYTPHPPPGRFPLAITFELADGSDTADALPPQVARGYIDGYFRD